MSSTTPRLSLQYPGPSDPANPPSDFQTLANKIDTIAAGWLAQASTAGTPTGIVGQFWLKTDTQTVSVYNGTAWIPVGTAPGTIVDWAGSTAPSGYVLCNGTLYSTTTYPDLYAAIGTTYGSGSGTFKVPDLRGRVTAGVGSVGTNAQPTLALAGTGGEQTHLLTGPESGIQSHTHSLGGQSFTSGSTLNGQLFLGNATTASLSGTAGPTNATNAHNTMMPYLAVNKIIKL
jgi:microcystin-dependent protein